MEVAATIEDGAKLSDWLADPGNEGKVVQTRLRASDRVIARVTDGIYREPASALRELISNAWDADARAVDIITDAPRFSRIYIHDDGIGMSHAALSRLVHHIGGSAKRQEEGQALGISSAADPDETPAGRPLIGKLGIGLFSVSQLARRFQIITKSRGLPYRLIAEVRLRAYSEEGADEQIREDDDSYLTGEVLITRERSKDIEAHGTDIVLEDIKPRVREILRSDDRWRALSMKDEALRAGDTDTAAQIRVEPPRYHAGWIGTRSSLEQGPDTLEIPPDLPWSAEDLPSSRIAKLIDAIEGESNYRERPDLETTLDKYLQTLWALSLSAPIRYVESHPFDLRQDGTFRLFWLSGEQRGRALELKMQTDERVRDAVRERAPGHPELKDGETDPVGGFTVTVDGVELRRPIRFRFFPTQRHSLDSAMLFVGRYEPDLSKVAEAQRGGDLSLEGYLFWNSRIIPKENNGVLVRVRGAAGALFDRTFFDYQVSEQNRLRQITSEIFVNRGLDAALNLDRESFNYAHPHIQLVTRWLHRSIRQLTNRHKEESKARKLVRDAASSQKARDALLEFSEQIWASRYGDDPTPDVIFTEDSSEAQAARSEGLVAFVSTAIKPLHLAPAAALPDRRAKAEALVKVLFAYGILQDRSYSEQQEIVDAILRVVLGEI